MSLIGIDIGSSTTKIAVYNSEGMLLGSVSKPSTPHHPSAGCWELEPEEVWNNAINGLRVLIKNPLVIKDPPIGMAISASTREGFPVDANGNALGPCIMTGDTRESGFEHEIMSKYTPDTWFNFCGHLPERMDPICRLLWWQKNHSNIIKKTRYFLGWAEYFSLRLTGKAVSDRSHAGRYFLYDFKTHQWSPERITQFGIDPTLLPEIKPWGTLIGTVKKEITKKIGLHNDLELAVGAIDAYCCVLGAGISKIGIGCLISGSWENIIVPVSSPPLTTEIANTGVSIGPYPGKLSWAINAWSPTGNTVLNWARNLVNVSIKEMEVKLRSSSINPSSIIAIPHLSGSIVPWFGGTKLRGAILGLSLASTSNDVIKSIMESIVYDLSYTLNLLKEKNVKIETLRALGGGTRSDWWTQLKADLTLTKIETIEQEEPGTLGAAMLAGWALGIIDNPEDKSSLLSKIKKTYIPNPKRAEMYRERAKFYKSLLNDLLKYDWSEMKVIK